MARPCRSALKRFKKAHGHCYVHHSDDKTLAGWVHCQRKAKHRKDKGETGGSLTDERIRLLDRVGFDWNPSLSGGDPTNKRWEAGFALLCAFKKRRGRDAHPAKREGRLGSWAGRMRTLYARRMRGEATTLTDDQVARLEGVGFQFPTAEDCGLPGGRLRRIARR